MPFRKQSLSFVTVCVGKPYLDYFAEIIKSYGKLSFPESTKLYVNTNHLLYAIEKLKDSPIDIEFIDFGPLLKQYQIDEKDYRNNDCIKVHAFINALDLDKNDFLFYVDADMEAHMFNQEKFDEVFDQGGFYHELCHTYKTRDDIEEHTNKRVKQILNMGYNLQFMKNEKGDIIFPIERFWGLRRSFCDNERYFKNEFTDLFNQMIFGGLRNDLYTESVELGHCFSKFFEKNKHINQGLAFIETSGVPLD